VLLSGGLDSAVALACARDEGFACHALSFDYGQRHAHELTCAAEVARAGGAASHKVIRVDLRAIGGSALTSEIDVPKDRAEADLSASIPVTYVPARNLIFLSLSLAYAETIVARDLFLGINAVDYSGYPDCRREFIEAFERTANLATKAGVEATEHATTARGSHEPRFRVRSPLVSLTKSQIIRRGAALGVDFSLTSSCYDPQLTHNSHLACGRCDSCTIRARGFAEAGVDDPTRYASGKPPIAPIAPAQQGHQDYQARLHPRAAAVQA
jgi:7-cyano-7-deazaguanine synthase